MPKNKKQTSKSIAKLASKVLRDNSSSKIAKQFAASALSQRNTTHQTGAVLEDKASAALKSDKFNSDTKKLAASVLSQSNKKR